MDIKRKIATYYLKRQYNNAKKYLERKLNSGEMREGETIEFICNQVRNAGIAYAQAEFCVFTENGSFRYNLALNGEEKCIDIPIAADDVYENTDTVFIGNIHRNIIFPDGMRKYRLNLSSHLNIVFHRFNVYGIYTIDKKSKEEIRCLVVLKIDEEIDELNNQIDNMKAVKNRILESNIE